MIGGPWIGGSEGILERVLDELDMKSEDVPPSRKCSCFLCRLLASLLAFQFIRNRLAVSLISLASSITITNIEYNDYYNFYHLIH